VVAVVCNESFETLKWTLPVLVEIVVCRSLVNTLSVVTKSVMFEAVCTNVPYTTTHWTLLLVLDL